MIHLLKHLYECQHTLVEQKEKPKRKGCVQLCSSMILYNYASFEVFMLMSEIKPQNNKKEN